MAVIINSVEVNRRYVFIMTVNINSGQYLGGTWSNEFIGSRVKAFNLWTAIWKLVSG